MPEPPGDQLHVRAGFAQGHQMIVGDGIEHGMPNALLSQLFECIAGCGSALDDSRILNQPDFVFCLPLEYTHKRRVGHRCKRMMAHAGLGKQFVADEQVALVDRALVGRKGRIEHREAGADRIDHRVGDRTDIALVGGIEGRAVLEVKLLCALLAQPVQRGQRHRNGLGSRIAA